MPRFYPTRPAIIPIGPSIAYLPLTQGLFALIDREDAPQLEKFKWQAYIRPPEPTYARMGVAIRSRKGARKMQRQTPKIERCQAETKFCAIGVAKYIIAKRGQSPSPHWKATAQRNPEEILRLHSRYKRKIHRLSVNARRSNGVVRCRRKGGVW